VNFLEIQDEVISDRFGQDRRARVKNWINYRYGRLWAAADWSFKMQVTSMVVPGGTNAFSRAGMGDIISIQDSTQGLGYYRLEAYYPDEFHEHAVPTQAVPSAFTVIGDTIYFNSALDSNRTFTIVSKVPFASLSQDTDEPLIPEEFHYLLVMGAASEGLRSENDPSWQGFEDDYAQGVENMKSEYLSTSRSWSHYPDWP
jgi:hypothetical protein